MSILCTQSFHIIITISGNYFTKQYEPNKISDRTVFPVKMEIPSSLCYKTEILY
jgi:hypothetical protein